MGVFGNLPLIGRAAELDRVADVMARDEPAGVVLVGPPGVGKTRLARECIRLGEEAGFFVALGTATRAATGIPFGALAPLLPAADRVPERQLDALLWVRDALVEAAGRRPLLLVIDDAHFLDDASAALVNQLVITGAAFAVATLRAGESAPDPIVALWKEGVAERIEIRPLTRDEADRLIASALSAPVDGATSAELWRGSQGNALQLRELLTAAIESGSLRDHGGVWRLRGSLPVSPRLTELIASRLAELRPEALAVLETLAFGEPLGAGTLGSMHTAEAIEEVERKGLVDVDRDDRRMQSRLAHPLYAEALRGRIPWTRAQAARRALADAVEAAGARRREDVLRVAAWRLDCGGLAPDVALRAARRARAAFDLPLAERLARDAIAAGGGIPAGRVLGDVLFFQGRYDEAEHLLAALQPEARGDKEAALIGLARSFNLFWGLGRRAEADTVARELEAAGPAAWRDEIAAERATYAFYAGDTAGALDLALPLLTRSGSPPRARARAAFAAVPALTVTGRCEHALALADSTLEVIEAMERGLARTLFDVLLRAGRALALTECGRLEEAGAAAKEGYALAVAARSATSQAVSAWGLGRVALAQGMVVTAMRWFREGAAVDGEVGVPGRRRWSPIGLVHAAALAGDVAAGEAALHDVEGAPVSSDRFLETDRARARAWLEAAGGDLSGARERLVAAGEAAAATRQWTLEAAALHDAARLGGAPAVVSRMTELSQLVEGDLMRARLRHVVALVQGNGPELEHVGDEFESMGAWLLAAESHADAARSLRQQGDPRRAARCERRAADLVARCEGAHTPALTIGAAPAALTARERDVATLAAAGLSSRAIAERLVLSVRTVDNHLERVYRKLGVRSRGELSAALRPGEAARS